jgi:hypothetical protein
MGDPVPQMLGYVWAGYAKMMSENPQVDPRDLERSITQLLAVRVRDLMGGHEPYYFEHGPHERETMLASPAQPPVYDLAFVFRADERVMWPLEAKVLETPNKISHYINDVKAEFLTCRYAPFSSGGAMLGYLLTGTPTAALDALEQKLGVSFTTVHGFPSDKHRSSDHLRSVPFGKRYPAAFTCHHMILEYLTLTRASATSGLLPASLAPTFDPNVQSGDPLISPD